jgi:class 3 adenylate cyclase/tetratricopeptide (TPR) repeat protein
MPSCPACGKDNPDGFQFCGFCGAGLAEPIPAGAARERKVVSVLFCDLVGFTASSESADPEEVQARVAPYHACTRERIEAFGGTVEKFIGDAVMAVFGAPVAHEDDAERAVRAGLAILDAIEELNAADETLALSVRIGINTGEALVSLDARPEQGEGMVTGDVVNTAARIQSAGPVDGVAVAAGTFQATERVFEYEPLEAVSAKGKAEPVAIWRALTPVARFGSDVIRSLTTPLVGRETDLTLMRSLFDKVAAGPEVQLVTLVGEPGVGKSRLVAELFAYIDERPELIAWRQGRCLPYGDGITFWALGEIVKAHAGIYESDSAEQAAAKLDALLPETDERPWFRASLLPLVGIESGQLPSREESFPAWRRFLERIAEEGPLVLVVEDVHWADEALLAFLEHLTDWAQGVPLLVVCTARPELYERHPSWGAGLANQTAIRLGPLSNTDTAKLVSALLEQVVLPAETQQLLLERAGGNPLYAEEFVRMLRDRGLLDERGGLKGGANVPFPDSIQALIAARLDTLPADRKQLLQDAAVMGKVFWAGSLARMGERDIHDVEVALHELARKELVRTSRQTSMEGEAEYGFWHLLVRDVAYGQIPRAERAARHLKASDWLEDKAEQRVDDLAEVLAYHVWEALDLARATGDAHLVDEVVPRARRFALLAGERAIGMDPEKALHLLSRALEVTAEDRPERAVALLHWARAARQAGRSTEGANALRQAIEFARADRDAETLAGALKSLSELERELGLAGSERFAEEAVAVLEPHPPGQSLVSALATLAGIRMLAGNFRAAIVIAERSLSLASELGLPAPARALSARGSSRCSLGDPGGLDDDRAAIAQAVVEGDGGHAAKNYNNFAIDLSLFNGPKAALEVVDEGLAFASQRSLSHARSFIQETGAFLLLLAGRFDEAIDATEEAMCSFQTTANVVLHHDALVCRTLAFAERGDIRLDDGAVALLEARQLGYVDAFVPGVVAAVQTSMASGDTAGTVALLEELLTLEGLDESFQFAQMLTFLVRGALGAGSLECAKRLADCATPKLPISTHALVSCAALVAEACGKHEEAARMFADAAGRWEAFGAVLEHAYALLGEGRCRAALGDPGADRPLREARTLFDGMGARPRVDECDTLIVRASKLSS